MPEFTSHPAGTPCWVDLMSPDVDASKMFYSGLFGWDADDQYDDDNNRVYVMFSLDGKAVAGLGDQPPEVGPMPAVWSTYVATDDCDATAAAVVAAGGSIMMAPMQVMAAGHMAIFVDPTGAVISVWKAGEHTGAEICNEPNTWSWNELTTSDVQGAKTFYSAAFGWSYEEMDMGEGGTYNVIAGGDHGGLGGIMARMPEMPAEVPDCWTVYFTVSDAEATLARVAELGGAIVQPVFPIEGVGFAAMAADPHGGVIGLMQPAAPQ
ncbi:MAG: VOC family protein [Actinomycetia bacterium]|nr:VOC family protein [Actinomycetes bacterium]